MTAELFEFVTPRCVSVLLSLVNCRSNEVFPVCMYTVQLAEIADGVHVDEGAPICRLVRVIDI